MRILRTALLTVAGGLLIGLFLFRLTTPSDHYFCCPVNTIVTQVGHTDFWTGEITPEIRTQYAFDGSGQVTTVWEVPKDWYNYRPIPLPDGFVVGSFLTLTVITIASRRPGKAQPNSAVPAV